MNHTDAAKYSGKRTPNRWEIDRLLPNILNFAVHSQSIYVRIHLMVVVMPAALPMHAVLYPMDGQKEFIDLNEVAIQVQRAFPDAVVDWDRGDELIQGEIRRFEEAGVPEVVLEGHRQLIGNTLYLSLAYPEWPDHKVYAKNSGHDRKVDDGFFLYVTSPFDIRLMIRAAQEFSAAVGCYFRLATRRDLYVWAESYPGHTSPTEAVRFSFDVDRYPTLTLQEVGNWKVWIGDTVDVPPHEVMLVHAKGFESIEEFAENVVIDLEAIGPVNRCWEICVPEMGAYTTLVVNHTEWVTLLHRKAFPHLGEHHSS